MVFFNVKNHSGRWAMANFTRNKNKSRVRGGIQGDVFNSSPLRLDRIDLLHHRHRHRSRTCWEARCKPAPLVCWDPVPPARTITRRKADNTSEAKLYLQQVFAHPNIRKSPHTQPRIFYRCDCQWEAGTPTLPYPPSTPPAFAERLHQNHRLLSLLSEKKIWSLQDSSSARVNYRHKP